MNTFLAERELDGGRLLTVVELTFGRARLCLANNGSRFTYDDGW